MPARLSVSQARRAGITLPATKARTTRQEAAGPYATTCQTCGARFEGHGAIKAENEHVSLTHCRFEILQGQRLYPCEACGRYTYDLVRHKCGVRS